MATRYGVTRDSPDGAPQWLMWDSCSNLWTEDHENENLLTTDEQWEAEMWCKLYPGSRVGMIVREEEEDLPPAA